ncbi:hypothetical protein [Starkeya nomas]|uniref:hypothetical protein n=1 Tax=Starkeya nomas TaxID=2666134 RepID=UPI00135C4DE0|nr:hypothetical protein [Starkeya nomas]
MNIRSMLPPSLNIDGLDEIEIGQVLLAQQSVISSADSGEMLCVECLARFMTNTGEILCAERFYPSALHRADLRALDRVGLLQALKALESDETRPWTGAKTEEPASDEAHLLFLSYSGRQIGSQHRALRRAPACWGGR